METVMANVRIRQDLKESGDKVLKHEGVSITGAVTALYEYLVREQKVPECLGISAERDVVSERRAALRGFAGCCAGADVTLDEIRLERLERQ